MEGGAVGQSTATHVALKDLADLGIGGLHAQQQQGALQAGEDCGGFFQAVRMTDPLLDRMPPSCSWVFVDAGQSDILRQAQKCGSGSSLFCSANGIAEHLGQVMHADR